METNQLWALFANVEINRLQSLLWRSETECSTAICIRALRPAMTQLYPVKNLVNCGEVTSEITFLYLRMVIRRKSAYDVHSSRWDLQTH